MGLGTILTVLVYLLLIGYLGYRGFRDTRTASDYLIAGRNIHPVVMALSYGATFISTSAIVGFGGVAGMFGMSLLWLTFCNIFVGIFIAFVFLGAPTRRMGHHLDVHTFPELLGRRFDSRFIQVFGGLIIFMFIPLYAAAVLIGGCAFISSQLSVHYNVALLVFSCIIAVYVVAGGLKGVMYTDALQGGIMFVGMIILLVSAYVLVGGVVDGHEQLVELGKQPNLFAKIGFKGWASMPAFGWGVAETARGSNPNYYDLWWIVVSTVVLGVGIGVLSQPQLAVRFMTVKNRRSLNRAVLVGGVFILVMTGVAFTVGSLSNVYFMAREDVKGTVLAEGTAKVIVKRQRNVNAAKDPENPDIVALPANVLELDTVGDGAADTFLIKGTPVEKLVPLLPNAKVEPADYATGDSVVVYPHANAYLRALVKRGPGLYECMTSRIMPIFIRRAMPGWFGLLFLLTLLAAAMSTLSSQFHAVGTSIGRDVYETVAGRRGKTVLITRIGIILGIVIAVIISYLNPGGGFIIARATAIFFGLCAATFLPSYIGGLFWRRMTRAGAISSMIVGFLVTAFWLLFVKSKEAAAIGLVFKVTDGAPTIFSAPNWHVVDPIIVALPISILVAVVVSLATKPMSENHINWCFGGKKPDKTTTT